MNFDQIKDITDFIQDQTSGFKPEFGIILGTGLGGLVKEIQIQHELPYDRIVGFPVSTVESHSGKLIMGELSGRKVVVMQGRFHYYEGYTMEQLALPVRVMKLLGIRQLYISNAAGGLNPDFEVSDLMLISDHINLQPSNPLIGQNDTRFGHRFPDMSAPYDAMLLSEAMALAVAHKLQVRRGIYASVPGPMLETPAEYKYLSIIGADAVGMSTVPEVIAARHLGLPVCAVSVITDLCTPEKIKPVKLLDILEAAAKAEPSMTLLIREMIRSQPPAPEKEEAELP